MSDYSLSYNTQKCIRVHLGEGPGQEICSLIERLGRRIDELERTKVDVVAIVPGKNLPVRESLLRHPR